MHIFFLDHIFQCQYSSTDEKQRAPTAKADKGFFGSSGKLIMECTMDRDIFYHGQELPVHVVINNNSKKSVKSIRVSIGRLLHMYMIKLDLKLNLLMKIAMVIYWCFFTANSYFLSKLEVSSPKTFSSKCFPLFFVHQLELVILVRKQKRRNGEMILNETCFWPIYHLEAVSVHCNLSSDYEFLSRHQAPFQIFLWHYQWFSVKQK